MRFLPGQRESVLEQIRDSVGPDIEMDIAMDLVALEAPFEGHVVDAIRESIGSLDPDAEVLPYLLPAGTDNKALSKLGIRGYGFVPLRRPHDFDFPSMFHGVDERVPTDSLLFGQEVLTAMIRRM